MGEMSLMSSPRPHRAYKDDSFGRGRGARSAIGLACRNFKTHIDVSRLEYRQ